MRHTAKGGSESSRVASFASFGAARRCSRSKWSGTVTNASNDETSNNLQDAPIFFILPSWNAKRPSCRIKYLGNVKNRFSFRPTNYKVKMVRRKNIQTDLSLIAGEYQSSMASCAKTVSKQVRRGTNRQKKRARVRYTNRTDWFDKHLAFFLSLFLFFALQRFSDLSVRPASTNVLVPDKQ